ncbi:MAG TPA: hypothetical protein VKA38_15810, partial [Draconibacterium sp.]|nr:hypothetical protein [Draconibacterium sp.]
DWYILEHNPKYDSLTVWIADTLVSKLDTLEAELSYFQLDSTNQLFLKKDTLELTFQDKKDESKQRRKPKGKNEDEKPEPVPQFTWKTNVTSSDFDLNKNIKIVAPEPLKSFDSTQVNLYLTEDTLKTPLIFKIHRDTSAYRTYILSYQWEPETNYTLQIDSASAVNIYGITSKELTKKFTTQEEDYYGTINLHMTKVNGRAIIQLLKNSEDEEVIRQKFIDGDQTVVFDYLAPEKYKLKVIYDRNGNGKWDPGSYQDHYLPERVAYINEVIKIRSNWDNDLNWAMTPDPTFYKNIRDKELEEQLKKEAQEKAKDERENPQRQQNNMFNGGRSGAGGLIRR